MYRVTTPTHTFTLPEEANSYKEIQITYKQQSVELIKHYQDNTLPTGMSFDDKDVIIKLTQPETKKFAPGPVTAQVRVLTAGNDAYASQTFKVNVYQVLNDEVLE